MSQTPIIGQIVHYELTDYDANIIRRQHASSRLNMPQAGDVYPAIIVRVWSETCVNLRVVLDGTVDYWVTSRNLRTVPPGDDPQTAGHWF